MVLRTHRAPGRVMGGVVSPRWISYQVVPAVEAKVSNVVKLSEEIALRLGATGVRISRQGGNIHIEVPREDAKVVGFLPLCQQLSDIPKQTAVLGLDERGSPLLLRLPSPDVAHALIAGTTGSGKTALAQNMILSLAMFNRLSEVQLVLIDPKRQGFAPFAKLPHLLRPLVKESHQAIFTLAELTEEMVRRDREGISTPKVVVFIDEVADLLEQGGNALSRLLTRLTQRGRGAGIHIVACTQKPLASVIGSLTKSNFPVRLIGSVASPEDAKVAAGVAGTGAEKLLGRGDFLLVNKGQTMRFQAAYATQTDIEQVIDQLKTSQSELRRWLAEEAALTLAATGTEGRGGFRSRWPFGAKAKQGVAKPGAKRKRFLGTQLRLHK